MRILLLTIFLLLPAACYSDTTSAVHTFNPYSTRTCFFNIGYGVPDCLFARLGWQFSNSWNVSGVMHIYVAPGVANIFPFMGTFGFRLTRAIKHSSYLGLNGISIEASAYRRCGAIELNMSRESVENAYLTGYYSIGVAVLMDEYSPPQYWPVLKCGISFNL